MKVFISWSGERSKKVALVFRKYLPMMINAVEPFMSAEDIEKGSRWASEIPRQLEETDIGLICITSDGHDRPWLNFEAGAISKKVSTSATFTFFLDLKPTDISGPLTLFQATEFGKDELLKLCHSVNSKLSSGSISSPQLQETFEVFWPKLEADLKTIRDSNPVEGHTEKRNSNQMLEEILSSVRNQEKTLVNLTHQRKGVVESIIERHAQPGPKYKWIEDNWIENLGIEASKTLKEDTFLTLLNAAKTEEEILSLFGVKDPFQIQDVIRSFVPGLSESEIRRLTAIWQAKWLVLRKQREGSGDVDGGK